MSKNDQAQLGKTLWSIADQLRGAMSADDFRDYMLSFLFLRYLSDNYVEAAKKELGRDYPQQGEGPRYTPLKTWYEENAADFAFLLHGFHFLKQDGVMAIILPHGVLFRGGVEARIRKKLLDDGHIDTVIGLPANLFYSTGIPVCILVLKKCKKPDDVLFINASEQFEKGKRQNGLTSDHIEAIIAAYTNRTEKERYSRRVEMAEIIENDHNLNITRYVSTAKPEPIIDLAKTHEAIEKAAQDIHEMTSKHNEFLKELELPLLPNGIDKTAP
jgi:type I restriction enzyme M protein